VIKFAFIMLVVMAVYGLLVLAWLAWALGKIRYSWGLDSHLKAFLLGRYTSSRPLQLLISAEKLNEEDINV